MAIKIGTNLSYSGKRFLDQRQGLAVTKQNLLSWSTPVPEGFEVYCEGKWYVYIEDYFNTTTGHFKLRIDNEVDGSQIQAEVNTNIQDIQHLRDTVYPIEFRNIGGGGIYLVGSQIIPEITWELYKDNIKFTADSIEVIVNGVDDSRGVLSSKEGYVGTRMLPNETSLIYINAYYSGQVASMSIPVLYNLIPKKYLILSDSKEMASQLTRITNWAGATTVDELRIPPFNSKYSLNCSGYEIEGGVYIHYLIPERYFPDEGNFQVLVGGLEISDYTIKYLSNFDTTNPEGFTDYVDICFNNKQNGLLNVEFKEVVYQ